MLNCHCDRVNITAIQLESYVTDFDGDKSETQARGPAFKKGLSHGLGLHFILQETKQQ